MAAKRVAGAALAAAAASLCVSAAAASGPGAPDLGAGPHRGWTAQRGGEGAKPREGAPEPGVPQRVQPAEAEHGASRGQSKADERRATERMDKAKKRPGYQKEAPSPRASNAAGATR